MGLERIELGNNVTCRAVGEEAPLRTRLPKTEQCVLKSGRYGRYGRYGHYGSCFPPSLASRRTSIFLAPTPEHQTLLLTCRDSPSIALVLHLFKAYNYHGSGDLGADRNVISSSWHLASPSLLAGDASHLVLASLCSWTSR
jgi:hypothetical protein